MGNWILISEIEPIRRFPVWGSLVCLALALFANGLGQDPAVDQPVAPTPAPTLADLPEDFPVPDKTTLESGETRGVHRTLKLAVEGKSFDELVRHFAQQLPEKNFRILNQTQSLPVAGFDRASSFTVRARNGAVFGLLVVEVDEHVFCILEGRF